MATNLQDVLQGLERRELAIKAEQLGVSSAVPPEPKPQSADVDFPPLYGQIIPGLDESDKAKFTAAFITNRDELGLAESLKSIRPDTKIDADSQKNITVTFGPSVPELSGKTFLVNPPGLDKTDVAKFFADMLTFAPAAKVGAAGKSVIGRFGKTATGEFATSIGLDATSQQLGSDRPLDYKAASIAALTGGFVEVAARPVVSALRGIINKPLFFRNGKLTPQGEQAARVAGLNPDDLGPALSESFSALTAKGVDPFSAGSAALSKEFRTDLTKGQVTGNTRQIETEEAIRQGINGDDPQKVLLAQQSRQQQQLRQARDAERQGVIDTPVQAGGIISEGVQKASAKLDSEIAAAYREVGDAGASFEGKNLTALLKGVRKGIQEGGLLDSQLTPGSMRVMREFRALSKKVRSASKARDAGQIRAVDFAQFELARRRMGRIIDTIPFTNKTDRRTAVILKGQLDKYLDDAFDSAMFSGDPNALSLMKKARALRTEFGKRFEVRQGDKEAGRIMQKMLQDNPTTEQVTNMLIGFGDIGGSAKLIAPKVVDRLNTVLGNNSDEMLALKEAVLLKIIPDVRGAVSPAKARSSINKALNSAPTLMKSLFTPDELARMRNFETLLRRLELPANAQNPSSSGFRVASLMGRVLGAKFGMKIGGTLVAASTGSRLGQAATSRIFGAGRAARNAVKDIPVPGSPGVTAASVAATRDDELQDF